MAIKTANIKEGKMVALELEGKSIMVTKIDDKYFAVEDRCPHLKCKLHGGNLNGKIVTCPCHGAKFDVTTGKMVSWVSALSKDMAKIMAFLKWARNLETYECTVSGEDINIIL